MAKYGNKGDIPVLVNPLTKEQKFINPTELLIYIGTIIQQENGLKKVGTGTLKQLGVALSENTNDIESLQKELSELKISYRKVVNILIDICDVLVNTAVINNLDIQEIKNTIKEDK